MKVPKHKNIENKIIAKDDYMGVLKELNTFIVDHHDSIQGALIIVTAALDKDEPKHHKGVFFLSGDSNILSDNLVLAISQIPEIMDLLVGAIIKGDLKAEFVSRALMLEAKQIIIQKIRESLNKNPEDMRDLLDPDIGIKN